jgi:hypothetical protein
MLFKKGNVDWIEITKKSSKEGSSDTSKIALKIVQIYEM